MAVRETPSRCQNARDDTTSQAVKILSTLDLLFSCAGDLCESLLLDPMAHITRPRHCREQRRGQAMSKLDYDTLQRCEDRSLAILLKLFMASITLERLMYVSSYIHIRKPQVLDA